MVNSSNKYIKCKKAAPTWRYEDYLDGKDGVSEPCEEAVEGGHLEWSHKNGSAQNQLHSGFASMYFDNSQVAYLIIKANLIFNEF